MKVWALLMWVSCLSWRSKADHRTYLVTAPASFCLDATETVLLQLFGFTEEVIVTLYLKTSKAVGHTVLAQEEVRLNARNHHQAIAKVRIHAHQLDKTVNNVILQVQSQTRELNGDISVPVRRSNGFLFIQTDKPLYTPNQSVKVRVFSMNQELRPASRTVFLTFRDPDYTTVDIVSLDDPNNGVPSMQNPFKIPIKPKLGIWTIEASYSDMFTTIAKTDFEVREYVLPSISIFMEPELNFISYGQFTRFSFKISARYLHGAPVVDGDVYVRYGHVSGKDPPVIIPNSVRRDGLSSTGEIEMTVNMEEILSKENGPRTLDNLVGKYLYIAVLVQENGGGISQEAEFASVKFVRSPYTLVLVSTPPFIKPGLPYNIQVMVKDHLNNPVNGVPVKLVEQHLYRQNMPHGLNFCSVVSATSQVDGRAPFICNTPGKAVKVELKFQTADPSLQAASQASLPLTAVAYQSTNERYIYIDPPLPYDSLEVGRQAQIKVYSATPSYIPVRTLSYLVLSKGKVVHADSQNFLSTYDNQQTVRFTVTSSMVPSIRLLVYYILYGEGTSELVADSVWMDVKASCVNGLKTNLTVDSRTYRPKENLQLDIKTNHDGLLALSAVDTGLFTLRPNYRDPVSMVLRHIEHSDLGCGGGGGKNNADVFRLAGLTFLTNGNAAPLTSDDVCTALVRPRRALTDADRRGKVNTYRTPFLRRCCENGMKHMPKSVTCQQLALQSIRKTTPAAQDCKNAFTACCLFAQEKLDEDDSLILGRNELGVDFDQTPVMVRSHFPESWLWEAYPISRGVKTVRKPLPDSLTTWDIKAISMSSTGICVAESVQVQVTQPVSIDVPLPYQLIRGEQVELSGSVYNQLSTPIKFCVTLTAPSGVCLLRSHPTPGRDGLRSTSCNQMLTLHGGGVRRVTFTVLGLEPGEHTLTFTLKTLKRGGDIVEKKLRVVPEGVRKELLSGGTLDPGSVYGWPRKTVHLQNILPANVVPGSVVKRQVMVHGETLGEVMAVIHSDDGLRQLFNTPAGSADWELDRLLILIHMFQYLEKTNNWSAIGGNTAKIQLQTKISQALVSVSSFKRPDSSYSRWRNGESSTWLTAQLVNALSLADHIPRVQSESAAKSIDWLFTNAQILGGAFIETSTHQPKKITAAGSGPLDQSVYLTSFVLIALHRASHASDPVMQLRVPQQKMASAAAYISQNALNVKSVYVRAVAAYALTLHDPRSQGASSLMMSLENSAIQRDGPPSVRYWQESGSAGGWVAPDQSSGLTVEMTAYVLQTVLLRGRIQYAKPIMAWLTHDQNYGEALYSPQDTVLTLAALTAYSAATTQRVLNQQVSIRYGKSKYGTLGRPHLTQSMSVATPIEVTKDDDIIVSTDSGTGVATVKMKTVFYQTMASIQNCNFEFNIEMVGERTSPDDGLSAPHLTACVKYKPPPNEVDPSSRLTVMKIQLPTGVEAYLEDLRQFKESDDPLISHYELDGDTVDIQMDSVPSDIFVCVGFRTRTTFTVSGASESLFRVYELHDRGSMCSKMFTSEEHTLQRLCVGQECQCMTAACAVYRGNMDSTLTVEQRQEETCRPHIVYAYRVKVKSSAAEGDFMTYTASVSEVIKRADNQFDAVSGGTELQLVKKATCGTVDIHLGKQYLVMGAHGSVVKLGQNNYKYRLALDSEALVEVWPSDCTANCPRSVNILETYAEIMQTEECP